MNDVIGNVIRLLVAHVPAIQYFCMSFKKTSYEETV